MGWFGFNVMSAQTIDKISGLVAVNSLMALVGGTLVAVLMGKNDPGFAYNGPLAGLVAVCAGSDIMHPAGALVVGGVAGALFVVMFTLVQNKWKIDDVLGVWPLHAMCGAWGGIAAGIFGQTALGGVGGVNLGTQVVGTVCVVALALATGGTGLWHLEQGGGPASHPRRSSTAPTCRCTASKATPSKRCPGNSPAALKAPGWAYEIANLDKLAISAKIQPLMFGGVSLLP